MTHPLDIQDCGPDHLMSSVGTDALLAEALRGLRSVPRTLPAKLFYDANGAALFERICTLEEYYLTRAEWEILQAHSREIARLAGPRCALVEYGSGAGEKVRLLLDVLDDPVAYLPIDISREQLAAVAQRVRRAYPRVAVRPVHADYTMRLCLPALTAGARRLAFFPGSTIGNFHPMDAAAFLRRVRRTVGPDGALLLGLDRLKDARVLEAAYNDREGVTAAFNLNMLKRLNREWGADFDLNAFEHEARFARRQSRIEMHLISRAAQVVQVAGERICFERGESILTECSYKFDRASVEQLVSSSGFALEHLWTDAGERFWVAFLRAGRDAADGFTTSR